MGRRWEREHDRMEDDLRRGRDLGIGPSLGDMEAYADRLNYAALTDILEGDSEDEEPQEDEEVG